MNRTCTYFILFVSALCLLADNTALAQRLKPGVLVAGGTSAGLAAAIQSANSGVETVLLLEGSFESVVLSPQDRRHRVGIYAELVKRIEEAQKFPVKEGQELSPAFVGRLFKSWTDTLKNLTVVSGASVRSLEKKGKSWDLILSNQTEVRADAVVDATNDRSVMKMAGISEKDAGDAQGKGLYDDKLYRTGVAISTSESYPATLPVSGLLTTENNFFIAGSSRVTPDFSTGQAAGAVAAYCAFFKTNAENLNIRMIQSELITYGSRLLDFEDVAFADSNAIDIHSVVLCGILKAKKQDNKLYFMPDSLVSSDELKEPVKEYYSRSQIWFLDHQTEALTVDDLLSLIKFAASRGDELNREVEKGWSASLKLTGKYDPKKAITRREAAVLINTYLKPFSVNIGLNGALKR